MLSMEFSYKTQEIQVFPFQIIFARIFSTVSYHLAFSLDSGGSQLCFSCSGGKPFSDGAVAPAVKISIPVNKSAAISA